MKSNKNKIKYNLKKDVHGGNRFVRLPARYWYN